MISLEDCLGLSGLTEAEVWALAEHEHVHAIVAAAMAQHLLCQSDGCRRIAAMIADNVGTATAHGDRRHAEELRQTLSQFVQVHPDAWASARAQACLAHQVKSVA